MAQVERSLPAWTVFAGETFWESWMSASPLQMMIIVLCVSIIASDLYAHRVRNAWLLSALLLGAGWMGWEWLQNAEASLPWNALTGLLIGLVVLLPFHIFGLMGAGDVKFFATLGFLLGGKALLPIWIIGSLLGGMHAVIIALSRYAERHSAGSLVMVQARVRESRLWQNVLVARQGRKGLPYAAYLAIGAIFTIFVPSLMHW